MSTHSSTLSPAAQPGQRQFSNATASTFHDWASLISRVGLAALFLWSG